MALGPDSIVPWIEKNVYDWTTVANYKGVYDYATAVKIILLQYQKDILSKIWAADETGKFPYSTVIWSQPKKNGKTQIAAAVVAWFASNVEAPNYIYTLASNQEQSSGLIFASALPTLYGVGGKVPNTSQSTPLISMPNGTIIRAIPNNYEGQAGGNYGLTAWTELWTYKSERDRRLFEEMPPVPTRFNSIRWIETYAGFQNESDLLLSQFGRIWGTGQGDEMRADTNEQIVQKNARPVPGLEHITTDGRPCCWHIPEEGLFVFWDHEIRAPWITPQYMREQKAVTRHSTYIRLWENRWQSSVGTYLNPDVIDDALTLDGEEIGPMVLCGDASQRNDTTALVGVQKRKVKMFGEWQERYKVMLVRAWDPLGNDLDLDETIAKYVKRLYDQGLLLGAFRYDPFQMHQVAINLRKKGVPCMEFNQGPERMRADTFLWKQFNDRNIDMYPGSILYDHLKAANAKEMENEQVRIIKGDASTPNKVDSAVALSMAVWVASGRVAKDKRKKKLVSTSFSMFE